MMLVLLILGVAKASDLVFQSVELGFQRVELQKLTDDIDAAETIVKWQAWFSIGQVLLDDFFEPRYLGLQPAIRREESQPVTSPAGGVGCTGDLQPSSKWGKTIQVKSALPELLHFVLGEWESYAEARSKSSFSLNVGPRIDFLGDILLSSDQCNQYLGQNAIHIFPDGSVTDGLAFSPSQDFEGPNDRTSEPSDRPGPSTHSGELQVGLESVNEYRISMSEVTKLIAFLTKARVAPRTRKSASRHIRLTYASVTGKALTPVGPGSTAIPLPRNPDTSHRSPSIWCRRIKVSRQLLWAYMERLKERARDIERLLSFLPHATPAPDSPGPDSPYAFPGSDHSPVSSCWILSPELYFLLNGEVKSTALRLAYEFGYDVRVPSESSDAELTQELISQDSCGVLSAIASDWLGPRSASTGGSEPGNENSVLAQSLSEFWVTRTSWNRFIDDLQNDRDTSELHCCELNDHTSSVRLGNTPTSPPSRGNISCYRVRVTKKSIRAA